MQLQRFLQACILNSPWLAGKSVPTPIWLASQITHIGMLSVSCCEWCEPGNRWPKLQEAAAVLLQAKAQHPLASMDVIMLYALR